ncbi:MAG: DNA topology modulation protein [Bacillota bacterium]
MGPERRPKKVIIVGSAGAGKSTLAKQLGPLLGLEVIHLDALFWKPGWVETPRDEWRAIQQRLITRDSWLIDGNYGSTLDLRLAAADTIIFIDLSRWLCLWRVLKRRVKYHGRVRSDIGSGCPESIDWEFFRWVFRFPTDERPQVLKKLEQHAPGKTVYRLRTPAEVGRFLRQMGEKAAAGETKSGRESGR